jgi:hypothetical protein
MSSKDKKEPAYPLILYHYNSDKILLPHTKTIEVSFVPTIVRVSCLDEPEPEK